MAEVSLHTCKDQRTVKRLEERRGDVGTWVSGRSINVVDRSARLTIYAAVLIVYRRQNTEIMSGGQDLGPVTRLGIFRS